MKQALFEVNTSTEAEVSLTFHDSLNWDHAHTLWEELTEYLEGHRLQEITLDFGRLETIDSAGASVLRLLRRHCIQNGIKLHYRSVPPQMEYLLPYLESEPPSDETKRSALSFYELVSAIGSFALNRVDELCDPVRFLGELIFTAFKSLRHIRGFRWFETFYYAQQSGADAMPIVFIMSFLIGVVMAFQAAVQLRQFGASIFVADLVSLALTRELGPVFTAVILSGRSGAAFAAEIGTMKVNEEVDALKVMGFDIPQFLVLPKVLALVICGPLLTIWADAAGILGGIVVSVFTIDLTARGFLDQVSQVMGLLDVGTGLIKSIAFSFLIGLIGCFHGLRTGEGADSVGRQATAAVVSGIALTILADAGFTVLFNALGW